MTVLVTGGAGYIGSHTARLLRELGRDVVVLDSLERGYREAVGDIDLVVGDIADSRLVGKVCRKYDVDSVIHFAAYKAVGESVTDPLRYYRNNVAGSVALVEALLEHDVKHVVFSSSAAVYGNPDSSPVNEDAPLRPESPYAQTKADVERLLGSCDALGMRSVSLRYFNAAGAHESGDLGEDCIGDDPHQPDTATPVHESDPSFGDGAPQILCQPSVLGSPPGTRPAIDADVLRTHPLSLPEPNVTIDAPCEASASALTSAPPRPHG